MDKKVQYNLWYVLAAVMGILILQAIWQQYQQVQPIPYSQFQGYLRDGKVDDIVISDQYIRGTIKGAKSGEPAEFVAIRVDPNIAAELEKYDVKYRGATQSGVGALLRDILSWVLPVIIFFGLWMFVFRKIAEKQGFGGGFLVQTILALWLLQKAGETGLAIGSVGTVLISYAATIATFARRREDAGQSQHPHLEVARRGRGSKVLQDWSGKTFGAGLVRRLLIDQPGRERD
jgi:hypothetical protein